MTCEIHLSHPSHLISSWVICDIPGTKFAIFETVKSEPLVRTTFKGYSSRIKSWLVGSALQSAESHVNSGVMKDTLLWANSIKRTEAVIDPGGTQNTNVKSLLRYFVAKVINKS